MLSIFVAYKTTGARVLLLCSGGSIAPRVRAGLGVLRDAGNSAMLGSPCGAVAQLGERRVRNAKVGSSILLRSTKSSSKEAASNDVASLRFCAGNRRSGEFFAMRRRGFCV